MTQTTEQNQSQLIEATIIDDAPHDSDGVRLVTPDELHEILKNRPLDLMLSALDKIESNQGKIRTLYRSQAFTENENLNNDLGIADGSDCELIQHIGDELSELKSIIHKAIEQLQKAKS